MYRLCIGRSCDDFAVILILSTFYSVGMVRRNWTLQTWRERHDSSRKRDFSRCRFSKDATELFLSVHA